MIDRSNGNLIKAEDLTSEQLRDRAVKAGKASVIAKRKAKSMKELANLMLSGKPQPKAIAEMMKFFPHLAEDEITNTTALMTAQISKALKGDAKAFELVRDTSGQKPTERNINIDVGLKDLSSEELDARLNMLMSNKDES
jgi:hypothetical protein